ncbi:component of the polarisome [Teratosphaeriaceae sp. CCFEE 6253]|nr:component of the polarisome [Teratosphaeriaceae sp. CCFEE 6253]
MSRPGPGALSPLSMNSADSFASRYAGNPHSALGGTPNDVPYEGGPYGGARPRQISPPGSQHPSSSTDMSRPSVSGSSLGRPPSSASSVGRSSDGRMGFGARPESGRSTFRPDNEDALQRHYHVLKGYLASSLRDEKGNMKPNKARDKLLRLSVTQFMELSTDVYDELLRREDERMGRVPGGVPKSLPPMQNFHPKRNQARQKLSTLPVERFRQLATDVFYELERRIPRFVGSEIDRPGSSTSHGRAPSRNGMRPPPGGMRAPMPNGPPLVRPPTGPNGMPPPNAPYQSFRPASPGPGVTRPPTSGSDASNYGRPLPKTFQSNTIVPNKSTMVEDDEIDDEDDPNPFLHARSPSGRIAPSSRDAKAGTVADLEKIAAQQAEIAELREKIEGLEGRVLDKEQELEGLHGALFDRNHELEKAKTSGQAREVDLNAERNGWYDLREELEQKHLDAQHLHDQLQVELDSLRRNKTADEQAIRAQHGRELGDMQAQLSTSHRQTIGDLRSQLDNVHDQTSTLQQQLQTHLAENEELRQQLRNAQQRQAPPVDPSEYEHRIALLQQELALQETLTNEVRDEAMLYLREMRDLSDQNDCAVEQEEQLAARVVQLEREAEEWRQRYARVKAQNKSLRASTLGLGIQTPFAAQSLSGEDGLVSASGLVQDVDVARFQLAIDDLLKAARGGDPDALRRSVTAVAVCVQAITAAVGPEAASPSPSPGPPMGPEHRGPQLAGESVGRLRARVTGTAKSLITATKLHAGSRGLSPVVLLDAAASNLAAAVVALIQAVGIRGAPASDLSPNDELALDGTTHRPHPAEPAEEEEEEEETSQHDSMGSFYADRLSPINLDEQIGGRDRAVVSPMEVHVNGPEETPPPPKPAPLSLGRSGTMKKGWFGGWGKKGSVDEDAAAAAVGGNGDGEVGGEGKMPGLAAHVQGPASGTAAGRGGARGEGEEYDPYK